MVNAISTAHQVSLYGLGKLLRSPWPAFHGAAGVRGGRTRLALPLGTPCGVSGGVSWFITNAWQAHLTIGTALVLVRDGRQSVDTPCRDRDGRRGHQEHE